MEIIQAIGFVLCGAIVTNAIWLRAFRRFTKGVRHSCEKYHQSLQDDVTFWKEHALKHCEQLSEHLEETRLREQLEEVRKDGRIGIA